MSKVTIAGDVNGTGVFTIASPNGNTNRTITLPDAAGTLLSTATPGVPIGGPAFSAYQNAATSLANNTATKIIVGNEVFDTNSNFASSTFTPTVAGYYQVTGKVAFSTNGTNSRWVTLYKNGGKVADISWSVGSGVNFAEVSGGYLIYMNGSTDYLDLYAYQNSGATLSTDGGTGTYFQAALVRSAT